MEENVNTPDSKVVKGNVFVKIMTYLLVAAVAATGVYFLLKQKPTLIGLGLTKSSTDVQGETDLLVSEVGKLMLLPTDERPTIATVADIDKLKDQPFFRNAQNGDKVLVYTKAQKAIIYRQSENKIIEVGVLNISQAATTAPSVSPTPFKALTPKPSVSPIPSITPLESTSPVPSASPLP